ncbi:MAG: hypothetical protein WCY32_03785 [Burkholderiaceae bacterium]
MRPFIVTTLEAGKLPRWGLLLLCLLYVLPGFVGRDPWRTDDAAGFGISLTMARGGLADWLMPNIAGEPVPGQGPLPFWIAGAFATLGEPWSPDGWLTEHALVRFASAALLVAGLTLLWYASYALARRPGVQPSDPFGASADSTDFGRAIADSALLVTMATFGLIIRMHETTGNIAQFTWVAAFLYGCAVAPERPRPGGAIVGAAIAATLLSHGLPLALTLTAVFVVLTLTVHSYRLVAAPLLAVGLPLAIAGMLAWPLALLLGGDASRTHLDLWLHAQRLEVAGPSLENSTYLARTAPWFYWPAWPVAAWAVWRWRTRWTEPAVALPLLCVLAIGLLAWLAPDGSEARLLPASAAMALLAAVGLPTLRRGIVNLIDWFAVTSFTVFGIAIWAWWIALMTGHPPRMAFRAAQIAPGFEPSWIIVEIVLGGLATLAWLALVRWRIARRPRMIWRAMVLSCGGLVLAWFLLMTLWLPMFNERNTYRDLALGLQQALAAEPADCVATQGLGPAQRASFQYFASPRFAAPGQSPGCAWLLIQDNSEYPAKFMAPDPDTAEPSWQGQRRPNRSERFLLFRRSLADRPVHADQ